MTTETRERIKAYKRMLPDLRERVIAVALLLAMSASMLGSASFAWITLSRAPEVSGMSTTVAANGNLEIALAQGSTAMALDPPDESEVGDSAAAQGIVNANVTWGNLINLSDPIYGISSITLRPASLSSSDRTVSPLYGVNYGGDGRVKNDLANYQYASWKYDANGKGYFDARAINYGVRAITSIKFDNVSANAAVEGYWVHINGEQGRYQLARGKYEKILDNATDVGGMKSMDALSYIISLYAKDQVADVLGNTKKDDYSTCITYLYYLMVEFHKILQDEGEMLRQIANLQIFLKDSTKGSEYFKSLEEFMSQKNSDLMALGVNLVSYETLKDNYDTITKYIDPDSKDSIYELAMDYYQHDPDNPPKTDKIPWTTIEPIVSKVVKIDQTYLNNNKVTELSGLGYSKLIGILTSKNNKVRIDGGIIKDTEQRLGVTAESKNIEMTIDASVTITAKVSTNAAADEETGRFYLDQDIHNATQLQGGSAIQGTDPVSKDTYGMAIDLWFRTNAADSVLTLEGHTVTTEEPVMVEDENGNEYQLYTITIGGQSLRAYQKDGSWRIASTHEQIDSSLSVEKKEVVTEERITGYEGENRIWEDMVHEGHIAQDSTTQGAGSCFVFYANPSDQKSIMKMLDTFRIFFMDDRGMELARARLITADAYAINGKVTVPIQMSSSKTEYIKVDENSAEETCLGITTLEKDEAKQITAIFYLDGEDMINQNVLSAGEIQGQLNLQFGSSTELSSIDDTELREQYRSITAEATYNGETSTDESSAIVGGQGSEGLPYDGKPKTVNVKLTVEGDQPKSISGFFVRSINATQGTREETEDFTQNADGTWSASFELTKPGKYMLRSVIVDGVEYSLMRIALVNGLETPTPAYPTVVIKGLNVSSVQVTNSNGVITSGEYMTADDRWPVTVTARIDATESLMPKNVRAVFMSDEQEYSAILSYDKDNGVWTGSTSITRSGEYTLSFLVLDEEYESISGPTINLKLGMIAKIKAYPREATKEEMQDGKPVYVNAGLESTAFEFTDGNKIKMPISVEIFNDRDEEQELDATLRLVYHDGTGIDAYGLITTLEWDGDKYAGEFLLDEPGSYTFNRVEIHMKNDSGYSEVRKAQRPPRIAPTSPYPPEYHSDLTDDIQITAETGSASINVVLPYATSFVQATLVDQNNREYAVQGVAYGDPVTVDTKAGKTVKANIYKFTIPGVQDGEWKIKSLHFWGVYANGTYYPAPEEGAAWDVSQSYSFNVPNAEKTYVIATLRAVVTRGTNVYTGENLGFPDGWAEGAAFDTQNATAKFMEEKKISPVKVQIVDWAGKTVPSIKTVQWILRYAGKDGTATETSMTYGGYSTNSGAQPDIVTALNMNQDGTYTTPESFGVSSAGKYNTIIQIDFADRNSEDDIEAEWRTASMNNDVVILAASQKPILSIKSINPSGKHSSVNGNKEQVTVESKIDWNNNRITIYPKGTVSSSCGTITGGTIEVQPQVTLNLQGLGAADSAALTFTSDLEDGSVLLYTSSGEGQTTAFTWTQSTTEDVTRYVGSYSNGCGNATAAGTLTSDSIVILTVDNGTYSGKYNVVVPVITIVNETP